MPDRLEEMAALLLDHARAAEKRLDNHDARHDQGDKIISILRDVAQQTNERIEALVFFIGDTIRPDQRKNG